MDEDFGGKREGTRSLSRLILFYILRVLARTMYMHTRCLLEQVLFTYMLHIPMIGWGDARNNCADCRWPVGFDLLGKTEVGQQHFKPKAPSPQVFVQPLSIIPHRFISPPLPPLKRKKKSFQSSCHFPLGHSSPTHSGNRATCMPYYYFAELVCTHLDK